MPRTFITAEDVAKLPEGHRLVVDDSTTVTPPALDLAKRRGITIAEGGAAPSPVTPSSPASPSSPPTDSPNPAGAPHAVHAHDATKRHGGQAPQTIIVTAVGVNRPGVMAEVTQAVGRLGGDIVDVSQKITSGYFHAIVIVDIARAGRAFTEFAEALKALSKPADYVVTVVDERVFRAMHRL